LGVACSCWGWGWFVSCRRQAQDTLTDQIDHLLEVAQARLHAFLVQVADEDLDLALMVGDEWLDVVSVEEFCALGLG
jgi:hypothetical protein